MTQLLLIALRNLGSHKRRTLLLGGAIAGVTALLVVLMGLSNGIQTTTVETATTLMTGHVNVAGFYKVTAGQSAPVVWGGRVYVTAVEGDNKETYIVQAHDARTASRFLKPIR